MTITDPQTFTQPVELKRSWVWRPAETVKPYNCIADRKRQQPSAQKKAAR